MGKEIKLKQDSAEWLEWRNGGLGASEMGIIMGALPFKFDDVLELWKLKVGLKQSTFVMNEAMQLGKDLEPIARKKYTEATNIRVTPKCYEHETFPFLRASLDGITKEKDHILEIKVPSIYKWRVAKSGKILDYYYPQVQAQLACSGTESAHYWVYNSEQGGVLINVPRNDEYIKELIRRATIFWASVVSKKPIRPHALNIDMWKESDPYVAGNMDVELLGVYPNNQLPY